MGSAEVPKRLSQKKARRLLESEGWTMRRGGKHVIKMTRPGDRPITLPMHNGKDYGVDLTSQILSQAGLKPRRTATDSNDTGSGGEQS